MINGWGKLSLIHGGIASIFIMLLLTDNANMFTFPISLAFTMSTIYCFMQYQTNMMIKRLESKYRD